MSWDERAWWREPERRFDEETGELEQALAGSRDPALVDLNQLREEFWIEELGRAGQAFLELLETEPEQAAKRAETRAFWTLVEACYAREQAQFYQLLDLLLGGGQSGAAEASGEGAMAARSQDWSRDELAQQHFAQVLERLLAVQDQAEALYALIDQSLAPLLDSRQVQELSSRFGKMLLLRLHNRQSAQSTQALEALEQERLLMALGPVENPIQALKAQLALVLYARARDQGAEAAPELSSYTCFPRGQKPQALVRAYRQSLISGWEEQEKNIQRFGALLGERRALAQQLGFRNFAELSFLREERLDFDLEALEDYLAALRSCCILAARDFRQELEQQGAQPTEILAEVGHYLPPLALPEPELAAGDWAALERFLGLVLEDQSRHFLRPLQECGAFWTLPDGGLEPLRPGQPLLHWALRRRLQVHNARPWSNGELIWGQRLPLLSSNLQISGRELPRILRLLGEGQAYLSHYGQQSSVLVARASDDLCRIWGESLLALAWDELPRLFATEEEGRRYREALMLQHLNRHCYQGLLLDFELQIYRMGLQEASELDSLWHELGRQYFPELAQGGASGRELRSLPHYSSIAQLWQRPLASLGRIWGGDAALALWDLAQQQRKLALGAYETLGTLGVEDTCMRLLEQARYPRTLSGEELKRRSFRLVWSLGR